MPRFLTRVCLALALVAGLAFAAGPALADAPSPVAPGVTSAEVDPSGGGLTALSCASDTSCVAVDAAGHEVRLVNGAWSSATTIDTSADAAPGSLSCAPATSFCAALGTDGVAYTTADGTTWTRTANVIDLGPGESALSCVSASFCLGVMGQDVFVYNGTTWSHTGQAESPNGGQVTGVSCVSTTFCVAVDTVGNALRYDGTSWTATGDVVDGTNGQASVSCSSVTFCATVQGTEAATYDGTSWSVATHPATSQAALMSVSCPSDGTCTAVDLDGAADDLANGTWTQASGVDPNNDLRAVDCPDDTCIAIDQFGYAFVRHAGSWSSGTLVDQSTGGLQSISCPTVSFCAASDEVGNVLTYDGTSWSSPHTVRLHASFASLSCSSATFCAAVGSQPNPAGTGSMGAVAIYDGTSWTVQPSDQPLASVSCAPDGSCVALGWSNDYVTETGGTWSGDLGGPNNLGEAVSCVSATFCATPGYVFDGSSWTYTNPPGSTDSISCASPTFCAAPDGMFMAVYNGTSWKLTKIAGSWSSHYHIDCPSTTFCELASNDGGSVTAFENGTPGQPAPVESDDVPHALAGVSCPSTKRCVAVDGANVVSWATHVAPTITAQPVGGTAPKNGTFHLSVGGQGMPGPSIEWQRRNPQGVFVNDDAATMSPSVSQGGDYRAVLTNTAGQVVSSVAHVVIGTEPVVTLQPKSHGCVQGATTTFTTGVRADPTPPTTWQISHDGGKSWADVYPPRHSTTFSTTCTKPASYRAVFSSTADLVDTHAATLTVWTVPKVVTQPADRVAAAGRKVSFTAGAGGSPTPSVAWQSSRDGTHWTGLTGAHATTLSVTATRAHSGWRYRAVFTNRAGTATTRAARLTVR